MTRTLSAEWQRVYAHPIYFVETFIDPERFRGTCYRAAKVRDRGLTADADATLRSWRQLGRASLNDPDTLAAALTHALAIRAGCCMNEVSTSQHLSLDRSGHAGSNDADCTAPGAAQP